MKSTVFASASLLTLLCLPVGADTPRGRHQAPAAPALAPTTVADALSQVVGKGQIVGITETNGTRFLGRVVSGDHELYVVQSFHFAGPPSVTTQATTRTTGSGRNRRTVHGTTQIYTDTAIPDDQAVRLLLSGVAGANLRPREIAGVRVMLSPTDFKYIQALSPPAVPKQPKAAAGQAVIATPSAARHLAWTITSLWPPAGPDVSKTGPQAAAKP